MRWTRRQTERQPHQMGVTGAVCAVVIMLSTSATHAADTPPPQAAVWAAGAAAPGGVAYWQAPPLPNAVIQGGGDSTRLAAAGGAVSGHGTRRTADHDVLRADLCLHLSGRAACLGQPHGESRRAGQSHATGCGRHHQRLELRDQRCGPRHHHARARSCHPLPRRLPPAARFPGARGHADCAAWPASAATGLAHPGLGGHARAEAAGPICRSWAADPMDVSESATDAGRGGARRDGCGSGHITAPATSGRDNTTCCPSTTRRACARAAAAAANPQWQYSTATAGAGSPHLASGRRLRRRLAHLPR